MLKDELSLDCWKIDDYLGWENNVGVLKDELGFNCEADGTDGYLGLENNVGVFKDELGFGYCKTNGYVGLTNNVGVLKDGLGLGWKIDDYLG